MERTVDEGRKIHNIVSSVNFPTKEISNEFMVSIRGYLRKKDSDIALFQKAEHAARTAYENVLNEKKHRVLIITGENVGRFDSSDESLISFIEDVKEDNRLDEYLHFVKEFDTKEEQQAFIEGLTFDPCNYDNFACREKEESINAVLKALVK